MGTYPSLTTATPMVTVTSTRVQSAIQAHSIEREIVAQVRPAGKEPPVSAIGYDVVQALQSPVYYAAAKARLIEKLVPDFLQRPGMVRLVQLPGIISFKNFVRQSVHLVHLLQ
jgi:hypothetical protein